MRTTLAVVVLCFLAAPALAQPQEPAVVEEPAPADAAAPAEPAAGETEPVAEPPIEEQHAAQAPEAAPPSKLEDFRHRHQVGIRATFGKGYRLAFAYGDHEICGRDDGAPDETPCYAGSPAFTDLDLSFGLTDGLEISTSLRLGLESEITGPTDVTSRPLTLGLGVRAYADPPARVKIFLGARILWDLTEAGQEKKQDFAIRAEPGLQVEIIRYVAVYLQAGATLGFVRWLRFEIDAGGGLQVRIP